MPGFWLCCLFLSLKAPLGKKRQGERLSFCLWMKPGPQTQLYQDKLVLRSWPHSLFNSLFSGSEPERLNSGIRWTLQPWTMKPTLWPDPSPQSWPSHVSTYQCRGIICSLSDSETAAVWLLHWSKENSLGSVLYIPLRLSETAGLQPSSPGGNHLATLSWISLPNMWQSRRLFLLWPQVILD